MGVRRALWYQCGLLLPLLVLWWNTTSIYSAGFTDLPVIDKTYTEGRMCPFAKPLTISLTLLFDSPSPLPTSDLESDLSHFLSQLSHYMHVQLHLQSTFIDKPCCDDCEGKMDPWTPYFSPVNLESNRDHLRIFAVVTNKECEQIPLERVVYVKKQTLGTVADYVVEITRTHLGLKTELGADLMNGFTAEESRNLPEILMKNMTNWVSQETVLFNTLMGGNRPAVSERVYAEIEHVRGLLEARKDYEALLEAAYHLDALLREPSLGHEEYFQVDFKVGVYAPLLVPPLFPLIGVAYSMWTRRKRS